jgi:hypothetical protein
VKYKGRKVYRETKYKSGAYLEVDYYPVFQRPGERVAKSKPTRGVQARLNQRNAEKRLTRLVRLNFGRADVALHMTYADAPACPHRAAKDLRNYLARVKRARAKLGLGPLKYVSATEISGSGRVHHHVIMSGGVGRDELERLWGQGFANSKRLQFGRDGIAGLSRYVSRGRQSYRRWNSSRNLVQPEPDSVGIARAEIERAVDALEHGRGHEYFEARYPGWELISAEYERNTVNHDWYVRAELRRRE